MQEIQKLPPTVLIKAGYSLHPLVKKFVDGRNPCTVRAYQQDLADFSNFLQAESIAVAVDDLVSGTAGHGNELVLDYLADLKNRGMKSATINRRLASLRSLVKLARTLGRVAWSIEIGGVRSEGYRDTRGPGRPAVRELFRKIETRKDKKGFRDRAILHVLYDLGLRRGEVITLDLGDVDLEKSAISILGKGKTDKTLLTLPEPTKIAVAEWIAVRGAGAGPLFTNFDHAGKGLRLTGSSLYKIVRNLGENLGIKVRPHGLRHTAITEACKAAQADGLGLEEVLDFSRHADVRTLMIYRDRERNVQGRLASMVAGTGLS